MTATHDTPQGNGVTGRHSVERIVMPVVAVLCVAPASIYHDLPGVEAFDMKRDVRTFAGGMPVVAHPPCRSWSAHCAHQAKPLPGERELGPLCVKWLRQCGGILEHPAHSRLFDAEKLPKPGEWKGDLWTTEVWQAWWGYPMRKATWLCFNGVEPSAVWFPLMLHAKGNDRRAEQLMSKTQRSATTPEFARWLVAQARLVDRHNTEVSHRRADAK